MLLLPLPPLTAKPSALVLSIESANLGLHSTSLASREGDCPFAWQHYEILWVIEKKMPSQSPLRARFANAVQYWAEVRALAQQFDSTVYHR
jgi:hypothetical protein